MRDETAPEEHRIAPKLLHDLSRLAWKPPGLRSWQFETPRAYADARRLMDNQNRLFNELFAEATILVEQRRLTASHLFKACAALPADLGRLKLSYAGGFEWDEPESAITTGIPGYRAACLDVLSRTLENARQEPCPPEWIGLMIVAGSPLAAK